jgi:hypothetical protein
MRHGIGRARGDRSIPHPFPRPETATMKKIRLDVDALRVETFETDRAAADRGTVRAHDASGQSCPYECTRYEPTCNGPLCAATFPVVTCVC